MNKTCHLIIIERIIIAASIDISVYFTNSKCIRTFVNLNSWNLK